ncbi:hypothetical protein [Rhodanobacter sp. FW106-PBR-R2A-1-13]|uniref:hypothetical protein n=1 Tax=Rhodanobacter sp. FW106-PBR-R2A-1-13 TaxID=3454845 RepID=UPI0034E43B21
MTAQKQRAPLIKQLAEDYLVLQRARYVFPVNPVERVSEAFPPAEASAAIGVRVSFVGDSALDLMMRAMPCDTFTARAHRIATLRQLAENGLAVAMRGVRPDGLVLGPRDDLPSRPAGPAQIGAGVDRKLAAGGRGGGPGSWGRPIQLQDSSDTGSQGDGFDAFDMQVAIA